MRWDKEKIQGSDWRGHPLSKCSLLCVSPLKWQFWHSVHCSLKARMALLILGRTQERIRCSLSHQMDLSKHPKEMLKAKQNQEKEIKPILKTKLMKQKRVVYLYISLFFKKMSIYKFQ